MRREEAEMVASRVGIRVDMEVCFVKEGLFCCEYLYAKCEVGKIRGKRITYQQPYNDSFIPIQSRVCHSNHDYVSRVS